MFITYTNVKHRKVIIFIDFIQGIFCNDEKYRVKDEYFESMECATVLNVLKLKNFVSLEYY